MGIERKVVISDAIIFTKRTQIKTAFREEFHNNDLDPENYHYPSSSKECGKFLDESSHPFVVLDWDQGSKIIIQILDLIYKEHRQEMAPVFLVAIQQSDEIIAAAAEYGVREIHLGEVAQTDIRDAVKNIFDQEQSMSLIRSLLIDICGLKRQNQNARALDLLLKLFRTQPDNERVLLELADTYLTLDKAAEADSLLQPLLVKSPNDPRLLNLAGRAQLKLGNYDMASGHLQRAKILNPLNPTRLLTLGQVFMQMGRLKPAEENFLEAAKLTTPGNKDAQLGLGQCQLLRGDINTALKIMSEITSPHEMASVFNSAAILTVKHGQEEFCLDLYDAGIKVIGKNSLIASKLFYNKGIALTKLKNNTDALNCFRKSLELDPSHANAQFNLAVLQQHPGNAESGKKRSTASEAPSSEDLIDDFDDYFDDVDASNEKIV
jgi:predicted Zn-dependent protease